MVFRANYGRITCAKIIQTILPGTPPGLYGLTGMETEAGVEAMLGELGEARVEHAPTMGGLARVSYTHQDMIDYMISHPGYRLGDLAVRYGYSVSWLSNISHSDAFKAAYAARHEEVVGPRMLSIAEQFEGVTALALTRLGEELEKPAVNPNVVLRAVELGARAMGVGGNAPPPPPPNQDHLATLAARLIALQSNVRQGVTYDGKAEVAP